MSCKILDYCWALGIWSQCENFELINPALQLRFSSVFPPDFLVQTWQMRSTLDKPPAPPVTGRRASARVEL